MNLTAVGFGNNTFVAGGASATTNMFMSTNGTAWTSLGNALHAAVAPGGIAFNSGTFVAVAETPVIVHANQNNLTAAGWGTESTISPSGLATKFYGVAPFGANGFLAVGNTGQMEIWKSTDGGVNWTGVYGAGSLLAAFRGIATNGSNTVAVGTGGTIVTALNGGTTFTSQTSGITTNLNAVAYTGNGFIAVGDGGIILTSPDGVTWTQKASGTTQNLLGISVATSGTLSGSLMIVGTNGTVITGTASSLVTAPTITSTTNASGLTSWFGITTQNLNAVTYGNGTFHAVGASSTAVTSTGSTPSSLSWTGSTVPTAKLNLTAVGFGNNTYLAGGANGNIYTSANGLAWVNQGSLNEGGIPAVAFNNEGTFFALSKSLLAGMHANQNNLAARNWLAANSFTAPGVILNNDGVCAIPFGNGFLTCGNTDGSGLPSSILGSGEIWVTSDFGLTWSDALGRKWSTKSTASCSQSSWCGFTTYVPTWFYGHVLDGVELRGLAQGGSSVVAVGTKGTIMLATNLAVGLASGADTNFTVQTSGSTANLNAVAYTGTCFIAVGDGGIILTSPDGVTWTSRASGTTQNLLGISVATSGTLSGSLMIVGANGTVITGTASSLVGGTTVTATPVLSSFSSTHAAPGTSVTVTGTNLFSNTNLGTLVFYNSAGTAVSNYSNLFSSGGNTIFTVPTLTAGTYSVADYSASVLSNKISFTIDAPVTPVSTATLNSLSPTSGPAGTAVSISGTGISGSRVAIYNSSGAEAGSFIPYMYGSTGTIYIPSLSPGPYTISATGNNGTPSNALSFTVTAPPSAPPSLSSVSPTHALAGATVTVYGSNFLNSASNNLYIYSSSGAFAGSANNLAPSGGTLSFTVPTMNPGSYTLAVTTAGGTLSGKIPFTIDAPANPAPVITQGPGYSGRTTITATGITPTGNVVTINGTAVPNVQAYGTGQVIFDMPTLAPGTYPVTLSNSNGTSNQVTVTVPVPPPAVVIDSVSPSSGPLGTTVTLSGSGFDATSNRVTLDVGSGSIGSLTVASPDGKTLTFTIPTRYTASGELDITVENNTNGTQGFATFTITAATSYVGTSNDAAGWEAVRQLCDITHWSLCTVY